MNIGILAPKKNLGTLVWIPARGIRNIIPTKPKVMCYFEGFKVFFMQDVKYPLPLAVVLCTKICEENRIFREENVKLLKK